jgi:hypothetical protein
LRPDIERLPVDIFEAVDTKISLDPVLRLLVADRADVPSPENVSAIPVGERNRVDLQKERLQSIPIDIRVLLVIGSQRDLYERVIPYITSSIE